MAYRNNKRRVGQINYAANGVASLELPRKYPMRALELDVNGAFTIATLGSPVLRTGGACGAAFRPVRRIEVIANGKDTVKSISGTAIAMKSVFLRSSQRSYLPDITGTGAKVVGGTLLVPFAMPRSVRPGDTLLPSGRLSTLDLRVTFGTEADLFSTAPTSVTGFTMPIEVHVAEAIRKDSKAEPYSTYKELYIEKSVTVSSTQFQILLPVGNRYRGFMIESESDGEGVDTILNGVEIRSGTDVFFKETADAIRGANVIEHDLKDTTLTGYHYIELCPDRQLVDTLDARGLSELEMVLDVAHPGTADIVRIYPDEIVEPA